MKNFKLLTLLGVIVFTATLTGCGNKNGDIITEDVTDAVINYNDKLVDAASICITSENLIWSTYDNENSSIEDIKSAIDNTINECTTAKKNINSIGDWEGDSSLREGIIDIIEKYITYYSKFSEILPYIEQGEISEEENGKYESLLIEIESLDGELTNANKKLVSIQEQFARNHGFELEANEEDLSDEEIEATNEEIETYDEEIDTNNEEIETTDEEIEATDEESNEETTDEEIE